MDQKCPIAIVANTAWYLANFRLNLCRALQAAGYAVIAIAPPGGDAKRIEAAGIQFVPLSMDNKGTNPIRDLGLLVRLWGVLRRVRPAAYLGYTVKPNVYGGIVCQLLGIPSVHNIAGLGTAFIESSWLTRVVGGLYKAGLRKAARVFFQNRDDRDLFVERNLVSAVQADLLPGSGVDTDWFAPDPLVPHAQDGCFRFLLSARLLWDKGVGEYVSAARQLRAEGRNVEFQLLGFLDADNRTAISRDMVDEWQREGVVRYIGSVVDVRPVVSAADCVVLPSYREGTPRSLLEAASMAKPIITTDAVGCREAIDDGLSGFLCRPRDAGDLAEKMRRMIDMPLAARTQMGRSAREKMVREFDERIVIERYLQVVNDIVP